MQQSGFTVTNLKEACPQKEHFDSAETYERRMRIPFFTDERHEKQINERPFACRQRVFRDFI